MKAKWFHIGMGLIIGGLLLGCAGKQKRSNTAKLLEGVDGETDLVSDLTGIDDTTAVKEEKPEEEERPGGKLSETPGESDGESIGGSQGAFLAKLMIAGKEMKGSYTVKRASLSNEVVKSDVPTGQDLKLAPGNYDFIFTTSEVVGNPKLTLRDLEILAGRRIKRDVKMPVGKITLVTGARCAKKPVRIKPKGASEWYQGKFYTCVEITLMAGEYEAEMGGKKRGTPISGIQVYDGGIREILIRKQ
ncbi:MAG: hypothetical protein GY847_06705 [Proteobacteria bacterium]|nr:hypothetical protein [Pseudomonadota bacterium]